MRDESNVDIDEWGDEAENHVDVERLARLSMWLEDLATERAIEMERTDGTDPWDLP